MQLEAQNQDLAEKADAWQARVAQLEAQNRYLSESYVTISNAFFWNHKADPFPFGHPEMASPASCGEGASAKRTVQPEDKRLSRHMAEGHANNLFWGSLIHVAKQTLFSEEELAQQRKQHFSEGVKFSIVACFGRVVFDIVPHMCYRQHRNNVNGAHRKTTISLMKKMPVFWNGPMRNSRKRQALRLERTYGEFMSKGNRELTGMIAHYNENAAKKTQTAVYALEYPGRYRSSNGMAFGTV